MWFKYIWLVVLMVLLALNGAEWYSAEWYSAGVAIYAFFTGAYLVLVVWWISEIRVNKEK